MLTEQILSSKPDWQPLSVIAEEDQDRKCRQCEGRFSDPMKNIDMSKAPTEFELEVSADDSAVTETHMIFIGNVAARQGYREIRADRISADRLQETAIAQGSVEMREPGVLLVGDQINFDGRSQSLSVKDAEFILHERHMTGAAEQLTRNEGGTISIENGAMTFCAPTNPTWTLQTKNLNIEPESGSGEAWGARLEVSGFPILYLPWIRFPIDSRRKTGLLFPDVGSDTRGGIDITSPIYFNLAPNYDALYSPRYIQERGLLHQGTFRLLDPRLGYWELYGGWLDNDDKYKNGISGDGSSRWLTGVDHRAQFGSHWTTQIRYTRVSDSEYIKDLENNSLSAQRQTALQQMGRISWLGKNWLFELEAEQFQSIAPDISEQYKKLPQLTARFIGNKTILGFEPIFHSQLSRFDSDLPRVTGDRLFTEVGLTKSMRRAAGFFIPTAKYRFLSYNLDPVAQIRDTSLNADSLTVSLDGGLIFERRSKLMGSLVTQTLEPRLHYLYSNADDQSNLPTFDTAHLTFNYGQLYRDTRFSGYDRLDDAHQISLGVTTRFFDNETGEEKLNASLGQIFYFEDREVRLIPDDSVLSQPTSPLAAELNWHLEKTWLLRIQALYDPNENEFDAASTQITYRKDDSTVLSVGYTLRKPPSARLKQPITEQANISAYIPIDNHWSLFGATKYSLEGSTSVENMLGVEYDNCCWRVRALYMRYIDTQLGEIFDFADPNLDRENAFQIQIELKGMGGLGGRVDRLLEDMIRGFNEN